MGACLGQIPMAWVPPSLLAVTACRYIGFCHLTRGSKNCANRGSKQLKLWIISKALFFNAVCGGGQGRGHDAAPAFPAVNYPMKFSAEALIGKS